MGAYPQIADWNDDGLIDLLVGDTNGKITLFINNGTQGNPNLNKQGYVKAGSTDLNVGNRASPVFVDWNNDNKKDLIVGTDEGKIRLYLNSGTKSQPAFTTFSNLTSNGVDIQTSASASPEVCDLDGDGNKDLVVSDYNGYVYFYRNLGQDNAPAFSSREYLKANNTNMKIGSSYARIDIVDWDDDGDLDILVGETDAYINLFLNTSNPSAIDLPQPELPEQFFLAQNYPNPFNSSTTIFYQLPRPMRINLSVFNLHGQLVATLVNNLQAEGLHLVNWEANGAVTGIYLIKLTTDQFSETKKCLLQK
ncbi:MAG: T9SS type A sorting domain-containing protein [candidate division KSB1 bacterium]|nr:T9SS type A sorting domain-containing protein [candidate division KSB1 bacterium]MDZ7317893.1 T9SS type A sorting domain-containing protein [candidate division KSB1 bacterium]MDZ7341735.1 T9SS type A sorting domain-containing protein [candidate division KSB1 bacterium]